MDRRLEVEWWRGVEGVRVGGSRKSGNGDGSGVSWVELFLPFLEGVVTDFGPDQRDCSRDSHGSVYGQVSISESA